MRIYIAGPYTKGDVAENVANAMKAATDLMLAGYFPFCPHLTHFLHIHYQQPYEKWLELDQEWLRVCEAVIRLPGNSLGADKEVKLAQELKIPVYYGVSNFLHGHIS